MSEPRRTPSRPVLLAAATLFAGGLALSSGCPADGPAETPTDGGSSDLRSPPDETDATDETEDTVLTDRDGGSTDADADESESEDDCDGRVCDRCVACKFREPNERTCRPDQAGEPPQRCDADPVEFASWGPASVLTRLELTSEEAQDCCFNIDGSKGGSPDNELGELASNLPFDVDREIKERLTTEGFATLVEHDGLRRLDRESTFQSNVHVGYFADDAASDYLRKTDPDCNLKRRDCDVASSSGESFLASPEGFEQGTHPQVQFHPSGLADLNWTGGPSKLVLDFGVRGVGELELRVHGATIEGDVDELASDPDGEGIVVDNGRLGGYVLLKDVVAMLNQLLGACECLDEPDAAIPLPETDGEDEADVFPAACATSEEAPEGACDLGCTRAVEEATDSCGAGSGVVCEEAGSVCAALPLLKQFADLDADHDGQIDALSVGAIFEMKGARIEGVADYLNVPDQPLDGDTLTVTRAFVNEPGWIALYSDGTEVGHRWLEPGNHRDFDVEVDGVDPGTDLRAVLHRDDGDQSETFEPDADSRVKRYPEASGHVWDAVRAEAP